MNMSSITTPLKEVSKALVIFGAVFFAAGSFGAENSAADTSNLDQILTKIQKNYDKSIGFSALFEQTYKSSQGGVRSESTGKVFFRKPMMVRWEYLKPNKKIFIASNDDLWIYDPEDNQVMHSRKFSKEQFSIALSFLRGNARLDNEFTASIASTNETGWTLKLIPKTEQGNLAVVYLDVSKSTFLVTAVEIEDALGNKNRFKFLNVAMGDVAPVALFKFTPPPDAEVLSVPEGYTK